MQDQAQSPEVTQAPVQRMIESIDDFAGLIAHWHQANVNDLKQLFDMPMGVEMTIEGEGEKTTLVMEGNILLAFQTGIHAAMNLFGTLPFAAVEKPPAEDVSADVAQATEAATAA